MVKDAKKRQRGARALFGFTVAMLVGIWAPSCDQADKLFDCQSVCGRYRSCFDDHYDVGACRSRCKDNADKDVDYQRKADDCQACIDDRSCASATFNCLLPCAGIVP
jgi:hypothetical protein